MPSRHLLALGVFLALSFAADGSQKLRLKLLEFEVRGRIHLGNVSPLDQLINFEKVLSPHLLFLGISGVEADSFEGSEVALDSGEVGVGEAGEREGREVGVVERVVVGHFGESGGAELDFVLGQEALLAQERGQPLSAEQLHQVDFPHHHLLDEFAYLLVLLQLSPQLLLQVGPFRVVPSHSLLAVHLHQLLFRTEFRRLALFY